MVGTFADQLKVAMRFLSFSVAHKLFHRIQPYKYWKTILKIEDGINEGMKRIEGKKRH